MLRTGLARRILIVMAAGSLLGVAGCAQNPTKESGGEPADLSTVKIGVDSGGFAAQIWVAQHKGFFAKHGIKADISVYSIGADTINATLAGKEDFGVATGFPILAAKESGQLRVVSTIVRPDPGFYKFAVVKGIKGPQDLVGKRIGVQQGTNQEYVTIKYLEESGVSTEDVTITPFPGPLEIVGSIRAGKLDAAWVFGDGARAAAEVPGAKILVDDSAAKIYQVGFLASASPMVEESPEVVSKVLAALKEASDFIESDDTQMREAAQIMADEQKAPLDSVLAVMKIEHYTTSLNDADLSALVDLANWQVKAGIIPDADIDGLIDETPLRAFDAGLVDIKE